MKKTLLLSFTVCAFLLSGCIDNINLRQEKFKVSFINYDDTTLYVTSVSYGETAVYQGETPTRPSTSNYYYEFNGWDKPLENIRSDTTFIAQYLQHEHGSFTISWDIEGTIEQETYQYLDIPEYKNGVPEKASDDNFDYEFIDWTPTIKPVTENVTYKAQFQAVRPNALEDENHNAWCVHGNFILWDGETINEWQRKDAELYEMSKMKSISLKQLKTINEDVSNTLKNKNVKHLYKYEDAVFGVNDVGWTNIFMQDNDIYKANGSYVFKCAKLFYDFGENYYYEDQWIPDPVTANAESLTPETFFVPPWKEAIDEYGFNWANNPVVCGGAGVYTIIVAEYDNQPSTRTPNYGIAVIKTAEKEGQPYEKIEPYIPQDHTYGLVGSFSSWGMNPDTEMNRDGDYLVWTAEVYLEANSDVKVRADNKWDYSWGYEILDLTVSTTSLEDNYGNIKITKAGTYRFQISFESATKIIVTNAY